MLSFNHLRLFPVSSFLIFVILTISSPKTDASPALNYFKPFNSLLDDNDVYEIGNITRNRRQVTTSACPRGQWKCRNNNCISSIKLCDGLVDCTDGSDETQPACKNFRCRPHLFRCTYGACVDGDAKCNGVQDCADNSDELHKDCRKNSTAVVNNCRNGQFQCINGQCISTQEVCDGIDNCSDKSDETVAQCSSFKCRSHLFRCAYGACVDGDAQCNSIKDCSDGSDEDPALCFSTANWKPLATTSRPVVVTVAQTPATTAGCVMPMIPENGKYTIANKPPAFPPGSLVSHFTSLVYTCNKGYGIDGNAISYCLEENEWTGLPRCFKKCSPVISLTADLTCVDSTNAPIPCGDQIPHGSTVTANCKPQHFPANGRLRKLKCTDGNWDYPAPRCQPECGSEKSQGVPYIIGGFKVKRGGFPWHVGIFQEPNPGETPSQICGGTIIANDKIISAAHCFYDSGNILDAGFYWVAAGKLYREWDHPEDKPFSYVQTSKVKRIHVPTFYGGDEQNQQSDIAVLILETTLQFSDSVHAACLDLNNAEFDAGQTSPGKIGKASGWGLTSEGGQPSEILKALVLPIIDYNTCRNEMPTTFRRYLTTDKFCAGYKDNSTSLCRGDSGGGLVVSSQVQDSERWYLRGIVSVGPLNEDSSSCRSNSSTAFTHVFKLNSWVLDIIAE